MLQVVRDYPFGPLATVLERRKNADMVVKARLLQRMHIYARSFRFHDADWSFGFNELAEAKRLLADIIMKSFEQDNIQAVRDNARFKISREILDEALGEAKKFTRVVLHQRCKARDGDVQATVEAMFRIYQDGRIWWHPADRNW